MRGFVWVLVLASLSACTGEPTEKTQAAPLSGSPLDLGGITITVPDVWQSQTPSSAMRKAQFVLPGQGEAEEAELVVFYFGAGNAGSVEANLERWRGQMKGAEGDTHKSTANGMPVTTLDVTGTYASSMRPMMQPDTDKSNYRMVASIVESPVGAYYFKLTGPESTVAHWNDTFTQFISSAKGS